MENSRRRELGEFLRRARAGVSPAQAGQPAIGRRLSPGLRREEVAALANMSLSWYTALEQGRDVRPSEEMLASIARTLQLSEPQKQHLFELARPHPMQPAELYPAVPAHLRAFVDSLAIPASILGPRWDSLHRNAASIAVFGRATGFPEGANALGQMFTNAALRDLYVDWPKQARAVLGSFRAATASFVEAPWYTEFVRDLSRASAEFAEWWPLHDVGQRARGLVALRHPVAGRLDFANLELAVPDSAAHLTLFWPGDEATAERLATLLCP